jgi:ParB-like chromosome segregation protein Spo0J
VIAIELWPIDRPKPYPRNARKISDAAVDKVAASIQEFGWRQPIVVDIHDVVVVGHVRLLAARKLELSEVPVHVADNLTPSQIETYRLMDNRSQEETGWDLELLGREVAELQTLNVDMSLTGFGAAEISTLLDSEPGSPESSAEAGQTVPAAQRCPKCGFLQGTERLQ